MRAALTIVLMAAAVYVLLGGYLFLMQERMLFLARLPGRELTATPKDIGLNYEEVRIRTEDGVGIHGWYVPASQARGTLLFLHGNAGNISHRLDSLRIFHTLGLDTLIIDYRGYGQSEGRTSERGTYLDAEAALYHLINHYGVDPNRLVIFGRSLGGAVAAWLAARHRSAALIIESTFTSAAAMGRRLYPFMPVTLITRLDYPVIDHVQRIACPLLVIHSRDDEIIPFSMAESLYAAAPEPKTLVELAGDHNNGFMLFRDRYVDEIDGFLSRHLPPDPAPASHRLPN